jgi:hypothetical protein
MKDYEIPLSDVYEEDRGPAFRIRNDNLYIVNRTEEGFGVDVVPISESEAEELVHILTAYLNRRRTGLIGRSRVGTSYDQFIVERDEE